MDIPTVVWLQTFLAQTNVIIVFVSHDRSFLSAISTDIIEMKDLGLHYFNGNYEDYLRNREEMAARAANAVDARQRREAHIQKSIDQAQNRGDDRMAKTKQKKLERAAFTKDIDGHRFKLFSLGKMDEDAIHMPEFIEAEKLKDLRSVKFKFPAVDASALRLSSPNAPLVTFDRVSLNYSSRPRDQNVLTNVTCQITLHSRIGIIGRNGRGKTTLLQALVTATTGDFSHEASGKKVKKTSGNSLTIFRVGQQPTVTSKSAVSTLPDPASSNPAVPSTTSAHASHDVQVTTGTVWRHHNLRIGIVAQHQIDLLSHYLNETPVSYIRMVLSGQISLHQPVSGDAESGAATPVSSDPSGTVVNEDHRDQEIRSLLGSCGLSNRVPLQPIGSLSGGQKARLSFAAVCALRPHILCLDEPSNHLSLDAIEALIGALQDYTGGIMLISHNAHLVSHVCRELWMVKGDGTVSVRRPAIEHLGTNKKTEGGDSDSDGYDEKVQIAMDELLQRCIQEQMEG